MNIKGAPVLWQEGKYVVINNYRNPEKTILVNGTHPQRFWRWYSNTKLGSG